MRQERNVRKYSTLDEMKADEYRYWQSRPAHERLEAVEEMIQTAYALKGWELEPDEPRIERPFVRLPCPWRQEVSGADTIRKAKQQSTAKREAPKDE
jgi:hypothetical protein